MDGSESAMTTGFRWYGPLERLDDDDGGLRQTRHGSLPAPPELKREAIAIAVDQ